MPILRSQSSYWNRLAEDGALSGSDCLAFYTRRSTCLALSPLLAVLRGECAMRTHSRASEMACVLDPVESLYHYESVSRA